MRPKELQIAVTRTINTGNYENIRIEAGMTAWIDDGDDLEEVRIKMLAEIQKSLSAAYRANPSIAQRLRTASAQHPPRRSE